MDQNSISGRSSLPTTDIKEGYQGHGVEGHDISIRANEQFINRAIAAAFYSSTIPNNIKGKMLDISDGTAALRYDVAITDPPMIKILNDNEMSATVEIRAKLKILGLPTNVRVSSTVIGSPDVSKDGQSIHFNVRDLKLGRISFGDEMRLPALMTRLLGDSISAAVRSDLLSQVKDIKIPLNMVPSMMESSSLKSSPFKLAAPCKDGNQNDKDAISPSDIIQIIGPGCVRLENGSMVVALDIQGTKAERKCQRGGPVAGHGLSVSISEATVNRFLQASWDKIPHCFNESGQMHFADHRSLTDVMISIFDLVSTFGSKRGKVRVDRSWVDYGAEITVRAANDQSDRWLKDRCR